MTASTIAHTPNGPGKMAHVKYWTWKVFVYGLLAVIYVSVIAEGSRLLMPALGQKLSKLPLPGFALLARYEETRRLDLALPFALIVFVVVTCCWEMILLVILSKDDAFEDTGWRTENYKRLILVLGTVIMAADAALFYTSMSHLEWGSAKFSFSALLGTAIYVVVLIFVSLVSVNLRKPFLKKEESPCTTPLSSASPSSVPSPSPAAPPTTPAPIPSP